MLAYTARTHGKCKSAADLSSCAQGLGLARKLLQKGRGHKDTRLGLKHFCKVAGRSDRVCFGVTQRTSSKTSPRRARSTRRRLLKGSSAAPSAASCSKTSIM